MTVDPLETERALAIAAARGDRAAFESLMRAHKAALYRFIRRYVGDADDAYDLLQESFIAAWRALRGFDAAQSFGGWLRTIALNKCRDHGRRASVRRRLLQWFTPEARHVEDASEPLEAGDEAAQQARRLSRLDQAIAQLPALYKEALLLTLVEGLTQQQAALQLRTSVKAIEMRLRRARAQLAQALSG